MSSEREELAAEIKHLRAAGRRKSDIARELGVTRQLVNYHLSDKSRRRRANMGEARVAELRDKANRKYARRAFEAALEE